MSYQAEAGRSSAGIGSLVRLLIVARALGWVPGGLKL